MAQTAPELQETLDGYTGASHARVMADTEADTVDVRIMDDGIGGANPAKGSGLRGLADRVAALDGSLEVDSEPGRGTTVHARIPVGPETRVEVRQPAPASAAPAR